MRSFADGLEFKLLLLADPDISGVLTPQDIERAFDLDDQLRNVDQVFDRVFQAVPAQRETADFKCT
jgi:adenylosuccinate lyase